MSALWPFVWQCLRTPARAAVVDDRRTYAYGQLLGGALFVAEAIESRSERAHVGVMLPTSGAFPMALMGCWFARRVVVPLNFLLAAEELHYVVRDSDIDTILTTRQLVEFLGGESKLPSDVKLLYLEDLDYSGVPPLRWPPLAGGDDLAVLIYTSGTSGKPKGVMLSHRNLRFDVRASIEHAGITSADGFLGVLPQFHSFGLTALTLLPLYIGSRVIYSARFVPRRIVELIRQHRPQVMMAVPSMYGALLTVKDASAEDFASVRLPVSGGEPLPESVFNAYEERLGCRLFEGFGMTETSPVTHWSTPGRFKRKSVGTPLPGVTQIVIDEQHRVLPPDTEGEILLAGPNVMRGYYKLPRLTDAAFVEIQGRRYLRTGDVGRIDSEGFLFITGRKKEMLIIAGENVFPREIEEVLNLHPAVRDSAVVGVKDDLRGELPIAFVEARPGVAFDESEVRTYLRQRLAQFKIPREIRVVEQLPRSPTGKILRRQLKV